MGAARRAHRDRRDAAGDRRARDRRGDRLDGHGRPLLDAWLYRIAQVDKYVFVVTYGCHLVAAGPPVLSDEHRGFGLFAADELPGLPLPDGYRRAIDAWRCRAAS